jgi:predicted transcriptional regulator
MSENVVEKQVRLSTHHADRLSRLAKAKALSEDQIIEKALDILFNLTDLLDRQTEQEGWSFLSENALQRVWDNEEDARYDQWKELYGLSAR